MDDGWREGLYAGEDRSPQEDWYNFEEGRKMQAGLRRWRGDLDPRD